MGDFFDNAIIKFSGNEVTEQGKLIGSPCSSIYILFVFQVRIFLSPQGSNLEGKSDSEFRLNLCQQSMQFHMIFVCILCEDILVSS